MALIYRNGGWYDENAFNHFYNAQGQVWTPGVGWVGTPPPSSGGGYWPPSPPEPPPRQRADYPLALRKFYIGYLVQLIEDWPNDPPPPAIDEYGSQVQYVLYQEKANDLLDGKPWKSQPQPIPDAVVNFFVDMRDANGAAQIIDRFFIDPLYPGPHVSLYYSNDAPDTQFEGSDNDLLIGVLDPYGTVIGGAAGVTFASDDFSHLDVDNTAVQFNPTKDWSLFMQIVPDFVSGSAVERPILSFGNNRLVAVNNNLVFTTEFGDVVITPAQFGQNAEVKIVMSYIASDSNTEFHPGTLALWVQVNNNPVNLATVDVDDPLGSIPKAIRFSGLSTPNVVDSEVGGYLLRSFMLKAGVTLTDAEARTIVPQLPDYSYKPNSWDDDGRTMNAILRMHPKYITATTSTTSPLSPVQIKQIATTRVFTNDNGETSIRQQDAVTATTTTTQGQSVSPYGFRGGPGSFWDAVSWTPICRGYTLQKGYMAVPPTKALFWKFEFTNLVAQSYDAYVPVPRTVKVMPPPVPPPPVYMADYPPGTETIMRTVTEYIDVPAKPPRLASPLVWLNGPTPAQSDTRVFLQPEIKDLLAQLQAGSITQAQYKDQFASITSSFYVGTPAQRIAVTKQVPWTVATQQPWQQGTLAPIQPSVGPHTYHTEQIDHTTRTAFFVGLKRVIPYRLSFTADDDTPVYNEHFDDDKNIAPGSTWVLDPDGGLHTETTNALTVSTTHGADHNIEAVQFATQQSDPVQIVPDDNFRDPILLTRNWADTTGWHIVGDATLVYSVQDFTVNISRDVDAAQSQGPYQSGVVQDVEHPPFSSGAGSPALLNRNVGGLSSALIPISPMGRIYAAVRLIAQTDLTAPLVLEIRGTDGSLLVSKSFTPPKGEIAEVTLDYTIGSYNPGYVPPGPWQPRSLINRPLHDTFTDTALVPLVNAPPSTALDASVSVRIVQYGATADAWKIDALSCFDDSIVWEFSNDGGSTWLPAYNVRNSANGVVNFPTPNNGLRWRVHGFRLDMHVSALQIRPLYQNRLNLRTAGPHRGPNLSTFDQEPPIDSDPMYTTWGKPVPRWWFLEGKRLPSIPIFGQPPTTEESRFLARGATEIIPVPADSASGTLVAP